ncbi:NACHT domain-containing protein [Aeromonas dhakensis]|uniref:phosphorylase family protein n=1 Tax=Aeromonas dhakensis TaxID=196024 RepID=UPI0028DA5BD7|nr:NACHT domain-containing protein [Aeromonas dhakensis]
MKSPEEKKPLIICITDVEYRALKSKFSLTSTDTIDSIIVEHGYFGEKPFSIARFMEMGSRGKDTIPHKLPQLISFLKPTFVIEIGICFGLKNDFSIGSVGICQYSADYELQKVNEDKISYRSRTVQSDSTLYSKLLRHSTSKDFEFKVSGAIYACGDKVVNSSNLKENILSCIPDAICGDMESYPLGISCLNAGVPWALIKASSDDGVNKGDEFQITAANNCVAFFESFIINSRDIDNYFSPSYEVNFSKQLDFSLISKEIFNSTETNASEYLTSRNQYSIHKHPDLGELWIIIYISKAHSIPEVIRSTLKGLSNTPAKVDVCIASIGGISDAQKMSYEVLLTSLNCKNIFIAEIGDFIFKRVIEKHAATSLISPPENYVDQMIYRGDGTSLLSSKYARTFIYNSNNKELKLTPISIILGQGGIGKTTFCLRLAEIINKHDKLDKRMLLITKADILKNYSGEVIDSISKLYIEYAKNITGQVRPISHETFSLALSCGSIILMIDGIDEIESALGEKFKMQLFLDSIGNLNESLNSCRVLMTSRDANASRFINTKNSETLFIKGFSTDDIAEYTEKDAEETKKKIKEFSFKIKNKDGLVNPYLLHVVRQFLISTKKEAWETQTIETKSLNIDEPFDYCLARALLREIEKQSLHITVDDYYDLLNEIVVEKENSMDDEYFETYIEIYLQKNGTTPPPRRGSYLKFFLFEHKNELTSISHSEYASHILLNKLYSIFSKKAPTDRAEAMVVKSILGSTRNENFGLIERLCKRLNRNETSEIDINGKIKFIFDEIRNSGKSITSERAIHELHMLIISYWSPKTASDRRLIIESIHSKDKISDICILSDYPTIDFSDCTVEGGIFRNFQGFFNCKTNDNTRFIDCSFSNCSSSFKRENVRSEIFINCNLDDGMRHLLHAGEDKRMEMLLRSKSDVKQVLKSMRQGLGFVPLSLNKIKAHSSLVSEKSYEGFIEIMCDAKVLSEQDKLYRVTKEAEVDAIALCDEDHSQGLITSLVTMLGA